MPSAKDRAIPEVKARLTLLKKGVAVRKVETQVQTQFVELGGLRVSVDGLIKLAAESRLRAINAGSVRRGEEFRRPYVQVLKKFPHLKDKVETMALQLGAEERRRAYAQRNL